MSNIKKPTVIFLSFFLFSHSENCSLGSDRTLLSCIYMYIYISIKDVWIKIRVNGWLSEQMDAWMQIVD